MNTLTTSSESKLQKSLFVWGFIPCLVAGILWVPALIWSFWMVVASILNDGLFTTLQKPPALFKGSLLALVWSLGGLSGTLFFARANAFLKRQRPWDKWCYIFGIHGFVACVPLIIAGLHSAIEDMILYGVNTSVAELWEDLWPVVLLLYLMSPIIMIFIAWYHRPRPKNTIGNTGGTNISSPPP